MSVSVSRDQRRSVKRSAWVIALVVICIYVGYIVWNLMRGTAFEGP